MATTRNAKAKPKFDWEHFKNSKKRIGVHCRTVKEAQNFRRLMQEHGMKWCNGNSYDKITDENMNGGFNQKKDRTVYDNKGQYGKIDYYNKEGWTIMLYSSYDFSEDYVVMSMAKKQKPKFDWNRFLNKREKIVVHCATEKEAETFCRLMHEHGLKWGGDNPYVKRDGTVRTLWNMNIGNNKKPLNCYSNLGLHDTLEYYNQQGTPILKFSSYDFSE